MQSNQWLSRLLLLLPSDWEDYGKGWARIAQPIADSRMPSNAASPRWSRGAKAHAVAPEGTDRGTKAVIKNSPEISMLFTDGPTGVPGGGAGRLLLAWHTMVGGSQRGPQEGPVTPEKNRQMERCTASCGLGLIFEGQAAPDRNFPQSNQSISLVSDEQNSAATGDLGPFLHLGSPFSGSTCQEVWACVHTGPFSPLGLQLRESRCVARRFLAARPEISWCYAGLCRSFHLALRSAGVIGRSPAVGRPILDFRSATFVPDFRSSVLVTAGFSGSRTVGTNARTRLTFLSTWARPSHRPQCFSPQILHLGAST
jgi:hypothetical protein